MIISAKDNTDKFLRNLTDGTFLSAKILAEYNARKYSDISSFYFLNNISMMIMGENISVSRAPDADETDEIISFCRFIGIYGIECESSSLPVEKRHVMNLMKYSGNSVSADSDFTKDTNIYGFSQFCRANFSLASFETVYSYLARKVNRGNSHIYYIKEGSRIVSGAMSTDYGDADYITFVSTEKRMRKKGYASRTVKHIVGESEKPCILMCENELVNFYSRLGFEKIKEVYLYILREENI